MQCVPGTLSSSKDCLRHLHEPELQLARPAAKALLSIAGATGWTLCMHTHTHARTHTLQMCMHAHSVAVSRLCPCEGWWNLLCLTDPALCRVLEAMVPILVQQFNSKLGEGQRVTIMEVLVAMLGTAGVSFTADDDEEGAESEASSSDYVPIHHSSLCMLACWGHHITSALTLSSCATPLPLPLPFPAGPVPPPLKAHKDDVLSITLASLYDTSPGVRTAGVHAVVAILKIKRILKHDEVG